MSSASCAAAAASTADVAVAAAVEVAAAVVDGSPPKEVKESLAASILRLKVEQQTARDLKKKLARELHNAQRRASRLKKRARQLTDSDLVEVLKMREVHPPVGGLAQVVPTESEPAASVADPHSNSE